MLRAIALALMAATLAQTAVLPLAAGEVCTYVDRSTDDCTPDCAACHCCGVTRFVTPERAAMIGDSAVSRIAPCSLGRGAPLVDPREIPHIPKA